MAETEVPSLTVEFHLWEHADHDMRCADCRRIITFGQPYASRVEAFIRDVPCCDLTCVYCAYPGGSNNPTPQEGN